ncbi:MAG: undecaprenyl/decaprenyl-phosphate alpha-N-acetylglucosaminyl 1-phosphate transferase [Sedimentisphaerales bacterium]|nr:undecaprenyl/decaprenyl-phosphate alpha-N-acetylglucosaminyl 1-phosphate transferase [Sedimentisphaerales bacterium]
MNIYVVVYCGSFLFALVITPLVIFVARHIKALDHSDIRKVHSEPTPRIGGIAIYASVMCIMVPLLFLRNAIGDPVRDILLKVIVMLSGATLIFIVGLIDDVKGLRARVKFCAQIIAAVAVCASGARIQSVTIADWLTLNFGWFSWPLTILWITGITNAVNLADGLDGLAAGISAVACAVIAIFAIYSGHIFMAIMMLALLGSLIGFLFFNFNPAKIFMGDSGSLFLGYTISASSVMCSAKSPALVGLALPMLALGIPIFDTLFAMMRRFLERRSVFSPDRMHFHHRLLDMGLTQRQVVIIAYVVTLLAAGLGMFMMVTRDVGALVVFGCILLLLLLLFQLTTTIRFKEAIAALQKKHAIAHQIKLETERFEKAQLYFRSAHTFQQWWTAVCEAAQQLNFAWISLRATSKDGTVRTEVWRSAEAKTDSSDVIIMNAPIRNRQNAEMMEFEIAILVDGSLESASHRATLFSRLIDEYMY